MNISKCKNVFCWKYIFYLLRRYLEILSLYEECYKRKSPVKLRIYDLSKGQAKLFSRSFLGFQVDGLWHTSIEVFQTEFWFGNGITTAKPGKSSHGQALKTIDIGVTRKTRRELLSHLKKIEKKYNKNSYDLLKNNCNNFSNDISEFLVNKQIPDYILELPKVVEKCPFILNFLKSIDIKIN